MIKIPDRFRSTPAKAMAAAILFAAGCSIGVAAGHAFWPPAVMAPAKPLPISSLASLAEPLIGKRVVTVSGAVAEVYGGQFVLNDASGRILVVAGRRGDVDGLVSIGEKVSVQGNLAEGVLRAKFLTDAEGRVWALKWHHNGHGDRHGPHRDDEDRRVDRNMSHSPAVATPATAPTLAQPK